MNKKIRELIYEECLKRQQSYISNEMSDIFFVQENLSYYELFEGYDLIIPLYEIQIFFLNLFYELNYREKVNLLNDNDKILLGELLDTTSFFDLIQLIKNDIYIQKKSIECVKNFVISDGLYKCLLLKSIDENLENKLLNILPLYIEDKEKYDKEINKDNLIKIYNDTKVFYEKNKINLNPMGIIKNYIMMLKVIRNDEYNKLIKEFDGFDDKKIDKILEENIKNNKIYIKK